MMTTTLLFSNGFTLAITKAGKVTTFGATSTSVTRAADCSALTGIESLSPCLGSTISVTVKTFTEFSMRVRAMLFADVATILEVLQRKDCMVTDAGISNKVSKRNGRNLVQKFRCTLSVLVINEVHICTSAIVLRLDDEANDIEWCTSHSSRELGERALTPGKVK
jgi:hypothetical protein